MSLLARLVRRARRYARSSRRPADALLPRCSFKDAVATIRRTTVEFQYQLIITRAYEEGEAELLDLDAESKFSAIASRSASSLRTAHPSAPLGHNRS